MLKVTGIKAMWEHTATILGGAILSMIAPVQGFMLSIALIILVDLWLAWRVSMREKVPPRSSELFAAVMRSADYFATLIVTSVFQLRFMPDVPLTYCMGVAVGLIELKRLNEKLTKLHNLDLWKIINERIAGRGREPNR